MSLDGDEEMEKKDKTTKKSQKNKKEPQTYIHETEDAIVDLADTDAFSRITSKYFN